MRIEQLRYFAEIAKTNSISFSAENLYVSQPAISSAIKKLEQELDVTLFNRSKNGVVLTPIGEQILSEVIAILDHTNTIEKIIQTYKQAEVHPLSGTLKIHLPPVINHWLLEKILPDFMYRFPNICLDAIEDNPEEIRTLLSTGDYDLSIFSTTDSLFEDSIPAILEKHPDLDIQFISTCKQYVAVSDQSPIAQKKSISLKELCGLPIGSLAYSLFDYDFVARISKEIATPNIVFKTNNLSVLIEQVRQNNCVSVTASFQPEIPGVTLIPISNPISLKFFYAYSKGNAMLSAIQCFVHLLNKLL